MQASPIVTAHGLHKAYGEQVVLQDAELSISQGERVGVVGDNGAGKSTLARILAGREPADRGTVSRKRDAGVLYLEQAPQFSGNPTVREVALGGLAAWTQAVQRHERLSAEVAKTGGDSEDLLQQQAQAAEDVERLGGWEQRHRALALLDQLGIQRPEQRFETLSGGERRRAALARILIAEPDLAILDEPTNHLDAVTVEWLEKYLLDEHSGAVLLVTHDRYLLDRVAQRTLEVADARVFAYEGGYERYLEQKAERLAHAARTEQNRQNFLRRELEWLRRQPKARGTKQKARIARAETALATKAMSAERTAHFELSRARSGKTILECRDLAIELNGQLLVRKLDLFLTSGARVGIVGPSSAGKTTLLRTLLGERSPTSGSVTQGINTRVVYLDQERSGLSEELSVFDNVVGDQPRIELGSSVVEPHAYLERFGFSGSRQRQRVESLSGGERARVALARLLRQQANLVVLDEPTNDLDVATLSALEGLLVEHGITALVVTHDRYFLDRVATMIIAFEGAGRVTVYAGNYSDYRVQAGQRLAALRSAASDKGDAGNEGDASDESDDGDKSDASNEGDHGDKSRRKSKRKLSFSEERQLARLPEQIEAAEARVAALSERLGDPSTYAGGVTDVSQITRDLEAAKHELEALMQRWEELETKKEAL